MKVVTLDDTLFSESCLKLKELVKASGFAYDCVLGIATGGDYVAREFGCNHRFSVVSRRPSTRLKSGTVSWILRRLPGKINDFLRIAEHKVLMARRNRHPVSEMSLPELPEELVNLVKRGEVKRILVIDDAVDTGRTLKRVTAALKGLGNVSYRTAVISQTFDRPEINPDFVLFPVGNLVRFPWSADAKGGMRSEEGQEIDNI